MRGRSYEDIGEFTKAETDIKKSIELSPRLFVQGFHIYLLVVLKRYGEAKKLIAQLITDNPNQDLSFFEALGYAIEGKEEEALKTFKAEESIYSLVLNAISGKKETTLILLQKGIEIDQQRERSSYLALKNNLIFEYLRDAPRFQEILAKHKKIYYENLRKYGDVEEFFN